MPTNSEALQALDRRERRVRRSAIAVSAVLLVQFLWLFWWFSDVVSARLPADLWVSADNYAREERGVLVDVSSRDPQSGRVTTPGPIDVWIRTPNGETVERYAVHGEDRRLVWQRPEGITIDATLADPRLDALRVTHAVTVPADAQWERLPARGGTLPPPGHAGLHAVTLRGDCPFEVDAVAVGGVPVVGVRNLLLFRLRWRAGHPVEGTRVSVSAASSPMEALAPTTDASGVAVFRFVPQELAFVEIEGECPEGRFVRGFELQPVWDGLGIVHVAASRSEGLHATIEDFSASLGSMWDVHCGGDAVAFGELGGGGAIEVPARRFRTVDEGELCVLQVYRDSFSRESGRALRPFSLEGETAGDLWAWSAPGVGFHRQGVLGRASDASADALAAWRAVRLVWVARLLWMNAVVLGFGWAWIAWEATRTRAARRRVSGAWDDDALDDAEGASAWSRRALARSVAAGWAAIGLVLGGVWMLFSLMGLYR